jgi:OmcA/MtrC family decaheme c-type cytochrome
MYICLSKLRIAQATRLLAGVLTLALLLTACSGSDGSDGTPGAPAGIDITNAEVINAAINSARVGSPVTVNFSLTDGNGNPIKNLPASAISFKLAKLVPGTDGNTSAWQSYINIIEQPGVGPGTAAQVQASTENGTAGTLADNNDGTYTYTFSFDIGSVNDPIAVDYVPTLTHRVTFEIRGYAPVDNPSYDWRPSDNATTGLFSREIAKTETCNVCHDNLALHGGARFELKDCVTCHNPGSADANSGNTVAMTVMTHKIHQGANLPSVINGGEYCIYGFRDTEHCYSDVVYPQDIRNCSNCHDENDPQTPDAARWYTQPSDAACGSCHDDVNFASGENHGPNIVADNTQCVTCHASNPDSGIEVRQAHRMLAVEQTANYRFDILNVAFTPPAGSASTPTVTFAISNPQLGSPDDQTARYALESNAELAASTLNLRLAWNTIDYSNNGSGTSNAQPQSAPVYTGGLLQATANGDLTYDLAVGAVPAGTTGSGVIVFEGSVQTAAGTAPVTATFSYFGITDDPTNPTPHRTSADIERCNDCHALTSFHGSNRNNAIEDCQVCHNANAARGGDPSRGPMDMKHFLHRKHAVDDIRYPQRISNCIACHTDDGFYPVTSDSGVLATSTNRGSDPALPDTNNRYSANAAACGVCHTDADAQVHMVQNGSSFDACQEMDGMLRERIDICGTGGDKTGALVVESCSVCHGPGRSADTAVVHKLEL